MTFDISSFRIKHAHTRTHARTHTHTHTHTHTGTHIVSCFSCKVWSSGRWDTLELSTEDTNEPYVHAVVTSCHVLRVRVCAADTERVKLNGLSTALLSSFQPCSSHLSRCINGLESNQKKKRRVAVLISGSGMTRCLLPPT